MHFALALWACTLLLACKGPETPDASAPFLELAESTRIMEEGDSVRLSYRAGLLEAPLTWSSSNTHVLTVDQRGIVRTLNTGEADVIVSAGTLADTCHITVRPSLEILRFREAAIEGEPDTTVFHSAVLKGQMSGTTVYVYKSLLTLYLLSEGLRKTPEGTLTGSRKGAIIRLQTPVYYGPARLNNGKKVFQIANTTYNLAAPYTGAISTFAAGELDEATYWHAMNRYYEARNQHDEDLTYAMLDAGIAAIQGATLSLVTYHSREDGYLDDGYVINDLPAALVREGRFTLESQGTGEVNYTLRNLEIEVLPFAPGTENGIAAEQNAQGLWTITDSLVHFASPLTYTTD